ncbi:MAG: sigma-70 family RNA polymerase sigma factor [Armatimonadetes bacterium]|nr:sigma-70 family RNA polymerase sigma factor [Armatimonadota bacterium]
MAIHEAMDWDPTLEPELFAEDQDSEEVDDQEYTYDGSSIEVMQAPRSRRLLTREEEIELAKRIERGDNQARQVLIDANHRLVFSVVNKYRYSGVPLEDLIQEGFMGLIQAADKFDYRRNCRFSTVATIWIRAHVLQAIQNLRPLVHVPQRVANAAKRLWRANEELTHELHRRPTPDELAQKLNVNSERVDELTRLTQDWLSLDEPIGEEGDTVMLEMIADQETVSPSGEALLSCLRDQLERAMERLSDRERMVLRLRFGLDDGQERTLDEIGKYFDLTRQRIKEIETAALTKLRNGGPARHRVESSWAVA